METMKLAALKQIAKERQIDGYTKMTKKMLIDVLSDKVEAPKSVDVVVDNIDWDTLLRNTSKQKLIDYSQNIKCPTISNKMTKQEILDEILFTVTKQVFIDLTK